MQLLWELLALFGSFWLLLDTFGYFWLLLATFGYFWLLWATFPAIGPIFSIFWSLCYVFEIMKHVETYFIKCSIVRISEILDTKTSTRSKYIKVEQYRHTMQFYFEQIEEGKT